MKFVMDGQELPEATPYGVRYPNDLLDGTLIDMPKRYVFLSDHVEDHRRIMETMEEEGYDEYDMSDVEIDIDQAPHSWVVKSIANLIIYTAEQACREAADE